MENLNGPVKDRLSITLSAGAPLLQLVSHETQRVHGLIEGFRKQGLFDRWASWNRIDGLRWHDHEGPKKGFKDPVGGTTQPSEVLESFMEQDQDRFLVLLEDFHPYMSEHDPENVRRLRKIALEPRRGRHLVLLQPMAYIPPELEKEMELIDLPLPEEADLQVVLHQVQKERGLPTGVDSDQLLAASRGLTIMEARMAFAKAAVAERELGNAQVAYVVREKEQVIKKSGHLEYYHPRESMDAVGGLDQLKEWLRKRRRAFTPDARDFGLDTPRGILLLGVPGTGKSLTAKAIAQEWHFPLLKLDMGKIFGGIVGQSEENMRKALKVAEALAPCVLWIDEIEKGLAGMASSGQTDGGTTARVLGTFLTWMQEKSAPVFVVATANHVGSLPPELLRKGRVDEIFFVDLPSAAAREEIIRIHLKRKGVKGWGDAEISALASSCPGFSGAEIEEAIKEAMFSAFDIGQNTRPSDLRHAFERTVPLSATRAEEIRQLRQWAKARAVLASSEPAEELPSPEDSKKTPRLRSEASSNPFLEN